MKFLPRIIKGLLLSALTIAVFSLNVDVSINQQTVADNSIMAAEDVSFGNLWGQEVLAQEVETYTPAEPTAPDAPPAPAAPPPPTGGPSGSFISDANLEKIAELLNWSHFLFQPLIFFFANHVGNLMGNDYLYSGTMGDMLKNIWIVSRNIVNIIFVLILLFLAIKQIFFAGEGEGNVDLKKALPKFVIMLIAINFSWLGARLIVDAADVATNVVFAIPAGVKGTVKDFQFAPCEIDSKGQPSNTCMPKNIYYKTDSKEYVHYTEGDCPTAEQRKDKNHESFEKRVFCWYSLDYSKYSKNNAALYMTYGISKIHTLTRANTTKADLEGLAKLAISFTFGLVLATIYLITFVTLFLAVVFRVAFLWLFIAFSPFIVLMMYLKTIQIETGEVSGKLSISSFAKWAFMPTMVGAIMSVGFIMISAGQTMTDSFLEKFSTINGETHQVTDDLSTIFGAMDNLQELIWFLWQNLVIMPQWHHLAVHL
jgi:hypothetical protein